jgi:hypothetical protein
VSTSPLGLLCCSPSPLAQHSLSYHNWLYDSKQLLEKLNRARAVMSARMGATGTTPRTGEIAASDKAVAVVRM